MLSARIIRQALKNEVPSHIYSRGLNYFGIGRVKSWSVEEDEKNGVITITGEVSGNKTYKTILEFEAESETFLNLKCSCPYGDSCKHAVALGLTFAESLKEPSLAIKVKQSDNQPEAGFLSEEDRLRQALRNLGLADQNMPPDLITQLLDYKADILPTVPQATRIKNALIKKKPPVSSNFYIVLSTYNGYRPAFYQTDHFYQSASLSQALARNDLTSDQRALLEYIQNGKFDNFQSPSPDPAKLFPLLTKADFPVYNDFYSFNNNRRRLAIDLQPPPLQAEIVYEPMSLYNDNTKVRHDFFLRLPETYWNNLGSWHDKPFYIYGSSLVREVKERNVIELHNLTPLLAGIISRLAPVSNYQIGARKAIFHQARLTGDELAQFEQLKDDASDKLALTAPPLLLTPRATETEPRQCLTVDFDNTAQTLRVSPMIDYGVYQQDVSESVYISRRDRGNILKRREPFEHPGNHIITVTDNIIHYAQVDRQKEIGFYKQLARQATEFGFTKTLKCQKRGYKQLTKYLNTVWPRLSQYAQDKGYEVIFTKDELALKQVSFRADFTADINPKNDWLYFDVACYCGDKQVTLEKLLSFLASSQPFWRQDDGTLVEIANRPELERLARLLQSFHARENGGFEGRLCHAAELEYVMTSSSHYNSTRAESFQQFLNLTQKGKPIKPVKIANRIAKVLRPYQKSGIRWLYFLRSFHFAGILADDMGLGKTLQTLTVLDQEKIANRPSVVVCPKTLLYNWKLEAKKFFPTLKVLVYDGNPKERLALQKNLKRHDLVIISYATIKQDEAFFTNPKTRFNYAILDEAQFIKNQTTKNAQIVKKLNTDYRLALTGTPLENSVSEIWSIYDFLMPGLLGNYERFARYFHKPIMENGDRQALEHLRQKIRPFMLRRTKTEVLKELPPKIEQLSQCHLSKAQNILYQQILAKVRGDVFAAVKQKGFKSAQIHILAGLTKLRQACNHPALLLKDKNFRKYESAKLDMCLELIDEVVKGRRKVLIFSQFTKMLDIVSAALDDSQINHLYLSGKTKNRQDLIERFHADPDISVFLISLKAGGTGLNLTAADTVVIFDPWWNPSVENQAIDRTHRIGQTKTVNVYRLLTAGTIEEKIQALKQKKQQLFDALISESGDIFKKLTWDDIKELFAK